MGETGRGGQASRTCWQGVCQVQKRRWGYQRPLHGGYVPQLVVASKEVMCSFCGINTHDYRDCPVMHQYIREQADALTQRRLEEYQQLQEWEGYEIPKQMSPYQGPLFRVGAGERGPMPGQELSKQETQKQKAPTKSGMTGLAYLHSMGGMAPGAGEELHHQAKEALQMTKGMMDQVRRKMRRMIQMKKLYR